MVGKGNAGRTMSQSGHPCPCQIYSQWPPAEETGKANWSRDWNELNYLRAVSFDKLLSVVFASRSNHLTSAIFPQTFSKTTISAARGFQFTSLV